MLSRSERRIRALTDIFTEAFDERQWRRILRHLRRGTAICCQRTAYCFVIPDMRAAAPEVLATEWDIDFERWENPRAKYPSRWYECFIQLCQAGGGFTPPEPETGRTKPISRYQRLMRNLGRQDECREALRRGCGLGNYSEH